MDCGALPSPHSDLVTVSYSHVFIPYSYSSHCNLASISTILMNTFHQSHKRRFLCVFFKHLFSHPLPRILWTPGSSQPLAGVHPDKSLLLSLRYSRCSRGLPASHLLGSPLSPRPPSSKRPPATARMLLPRAPQLPASISPRQRL